MKKRIEFITLIILMIVIGIILLVSVLNKDKTLEINNYYDEKANLILKGENNKGMEEEREEKLEEIKEANKKAREQKEEAYSK